MRALLRSHGFENSKLSKLALFGVAYIVMWTFVKSQTWPRCSSGRRKDTGEGKTRASSTNDGGDEERESETDGASRLEQKGRRQVLRTQCSIKCQKRKVGHVRQGSSRCTHRQNPVRVLDPCASRCERRTFLLEWLSRRTTRDASAHRVVDFLKIVIRNCNH